MPTADLTSIVPPDLDLIRNGDREQLANAIGALWDRAVQQAAFDPRGRVGDWQTPPFNAGDYLVQPGTGNSWVVADPAILGFAPTLRWMRARNTIWVNVNIINSSYTSVLGSNFVRITMPGGFFGAGGTQSWRSWAYMENGASLVVRPAYMNLAVGPIAGTAEITITRTDANLVNDSAFIIIGTLMFEASP